MLKIEFDPPGYDPLPYFDFLDSVAAQVLSELLPGVDITLQYEQVREDPERPGVKSIELKFRPSPDIIGYSAESILGEPGWWRRVTIRMPSVSM